MRWAPKIALALVGALCAAPAAAQAWTVRVDGDSVGAVAARPDGAPPADDALALAADLGWALAAVDSTAADSATVALVGGTPLVVGRVTVVGADDAATSRWATRTGRPYAERALAADLDAVVAGLVADGYADARAVARTSVRPEAAALVVDVEVDVDAGAPAEIAGVELVGARRPARAFATRVAGLPAGTPLARYDAVSVRESLDATGLYVAVGEPVLARERDGRVVVRVPVEPGPPGAFDLVVGYLPPSGGAGGRVVGSGRLDLFDPFGGGQSVRVALERNPGLVSRVTASARDPFVAGLPVSLAAAFDGETRDSTFSRQSVRADVGTRIAPGLTLTLGASRDAVLPGRAAALPGGASLVRRSTAVFAGAGLRFVNVDRVRAPWRGLVAEVAVESGVRRRAAVADSALADSLVGEARAPRQQRLSASARVYRPVTRRLGLVAGLDARLLVSGRGAGGEGAVAYDEGELFRLGGAATLRGYDEEAFLGRGVGRVLGEARWRLDDGSFVFAFADVGYVVRPDLPGRPGSRRTRPGYGAGLQLVTGLGPVSVTYALNPDLPASRGKLHLGLSVGL